MNVLSLFDGISCGKVALDRAGVEVGTYYASEVDKWASIISDKNFPNIVRLGDVTKNDDWNIGSIDLLIGGSPCQSISNLGDGSGLDGKSGLFYEYLKCLHKYKPKYFLLENVSGSKAAINKINEEVGCEPLKINSNLFSAQNRNRLYWTNIPVDMNIEDKGVTLQDILESGVPKQSVLTESRLRWFLSDKGQDTLKRRYSSLDPVKASCLTARSDASWNSNYVTRKGVVTRLTPTEYERLQTLPDNYTLVRSEDGKQIVSDSQRYKALGNGWTVDVIAHILSGIKGE